MKTKKIQEIEWLANKAVDKAKTFDELFETLQEVLCVIEEDDTEISGGGE